MQHATCNMQLHQHQHQHQHQPTLRNTTYYKSNQNQTKQNKTKQNSNALRCELYILWLDWNKNMLKEANRTERRGKGDTKSTLLALLSTLDSTLVPVDQDVLKNANTTTNLHRRLVTQLLCGAICYSTCKRVAKLPKCFTFCRQWQRPFLLGG